MSIRAIPLFATFCAAAALARSPAMAGDVPAPPGNTGTPADGEAGELRLPLDLFFGDEPDERIVAAFEAAHRRIQDLEAAVAEAAKTYAGTVREAFPSSRDGKIRRAEIYRRAQAAIDVAMLLRLRGTIPSMKLVVRAGGRGNIHLRPAVRALAELGVEDDFWVECLTKPGEDERNHVACVVLCEVWDSPSEKIRSAIALLRRQIEERRAKGEKINLGLGIPLALKRMSDMEALEAQYAKGTIAEQLGLVEATGPIRREALSGRWLGDYAPNPLWDASRDSDYLHFRWARRRLLELSEKAPQAVVEYVLALPRRLAQEGKLPEADVAAYRQRLMQCVTSAVRKEIEKRLKDAAPEAKK